MTQRAKSTRPSLHHLIALLLTGAAIGGFAACGGLTPAAVGDACEPDGDPCPSPSICAPGGEDHICQLEPGSPCDPAGPDYCIGASTCGDQGDGTGLCSLPEGSACDPDGPPCDDGLACDPAGETFLCFPEVTITGMVFDAETEAPIADAHVHAFDDAATAVSDVAITDADGRYSLSVPVERNQDGTPVEDAIFTLRASAADYQTFPGGIRDALPVQSSDAESGPLGYVIETPVTSIALIPLPEAEQGNASIEGTVLADDPGGVLVVAADGDGAFSAVSDKAGSYTIFNVPGGSYEVRGYAAGVQLEPASAEVADAAVVGIDLVESGAALATIEGNIQIVNAPGGSQTSVVLVVEDTFQDTFVKGEIPRGLRAPLTGAPSISGDFSIAGVPAGDYVVLAAFENDDLVRDPDQNIAGTDLVFISVPAPGETIALSESFKVTEALAVIAPGADNPESVGSSPTLRWADDSSEDYYTLQVYNAFGDLVWDVADVEAEGGTIEGGEVSIAYGGDALEPGMYYQFRATSWRQPGGMNASPISTTEDLRGVFYLE